jgi:hypothetical protein
MSESAPKLAFFGGEPLGVTALKALIEANLKPELVVCNPDRPSGRGQKLSPPAVKVLAEEQSIEVFQPSSYKQQSKLNRLIDPDWDLFIVVAYNFILPKWVLELPSHGVIYACAGIGDSYFEHEGQRIKIKQAKLNPDGSLRLLRVTPAGKSEMDFEQYLQIIS